MEEYSEWLKRPIENRNKIMFQMDRIMSQDIDLEGLLIAISVDIMDADSTREMKTNCSHLLKKINSEYRYKYVDENVKLKISDMIENMCCFKNVNCVSDSFSRCCKNCSMRLSHAICEYTSLDRIQQKTESILESLFFSNLSLNECEFKLQYFIKCLKCYGYLDKINLSVFNRFHEYFSQNGFTSLRNILISEGITPTLEDQMIELTITN